MWSGLLSVELRIAKLESTRRKSEEMSDNNAPVMITAQADRNFVTILNAYKHLKTIKKVTLICVLILSMVPFAWGISALAVFLTLALCLGTLAYLVVSQEQVISELQRALYSICLRSVSEQVNVDGEINSNED